MKSPLENAVGRTEISIFCNVAMSHIKGWVSESLWESGFRRGGVRKKQEKNSRKSDHTWVMTTSYITST